VSEAAGSDGLRALTRHTGFLRYQVVRLCSVVSIQILAVVVGWQAWDRTRDPAVLGWVGGVQFLPMLLLTFVSGEVADRFDRGRVLQICHLGIAVVAGALLFWSSATEGSTSFSGAYAALFCFGCFRAFAGPAGQALLPSLVPPLLYPRAVALASTTFQGAILLGPAIGGVVFGALGAPAAYGLSAALQLLAFALLFFVHGEHEPRKFSVDGSTLERLGGGLRFVRSRPVILGAISLDLFAVLLGGAVALMPYYAREVLDIGEAGLGLLRSAPAIGAVVVAVYLGARPLGRHAGKVLLSCVAIFGAATIVFGSSETLWISLTALVVLGAADMVSIVVRHVAIQGSTPPEMRGRVAAVSMLFISASNELGELESGLVASWLGPERSVIVGGALAIVVTVLWALLFPSLRRFGEDTPA
jgi:MFS family permease